MATYTVTGAEVGQTLETNGILSGIKIVDLQGPYRALFTVVSVGGIVPERVLYNFDPSTSHVSPGDVLVHDQTIPFVDLVVKNLPTGSTYELTTISPPTLTSLSPNTAVSGDPDFVLSCIGTGFTGNSVIIFGTEDEPTTLVSDTEVTTIVKPSLFAPAVVPVSIRIGDSSFTTAPLDFTFTEPVERELVPTLESMNPTTAVAGSGDLALNATGTNFTPDSILVVGEVDLQTGVTGSTKIAGLLKPSEYPAGVYEVQVRNGAELSNSLDFTFTEE